MGALGKTLDTVFGGGFSDAWNAVEYTGGLYSRLVIQLEQWDWTYQDGWERVDYV